MNFASVGSSIINTHSVVAYKGSAGLIDYSCTKGTRSVVFVRNFVAGAISTFTISLAQQLGKRGIRVNSVAPGPIWTPLQPATGWPSEKLEKLGHDTWLGRAGQPEEVAPAYVFLASLDGRCAHPCNVQNLIDT